jgi:beta-alanine--pyruvate transaminase
LHDQVIDAAAPGVELSHGYTYSGHPLCAAAGLATLELYARERLFVRAAALAPYWEDAAHSLRDRCGVRDVRNLGLVAGIELEPRPGAPGARAMEIFHRCFDEGLLIRVTADTIALSPPLIVEKTQIDEIFGRLGEVIDQIG